MRDCGIKSGGIQLKILYNTSIFIAAALTGHLLSAPPLRAQSAPVSEASVTGGLTLLDDMAARAVAQGAVPGLSIAVVHDDRVVYLKGFGLREMGRPETVDADTVFQLASLSKPVSSTTVAALVGKQLLDWDSRIADLAPEYQLRDAYPSQQVTVRDLFNHRSGLPGNAGNDLESIGFDRETILRRLALIAPASSFRAGYAYSNAGLTMGALAAARRVGRDWETISEEFLYRPLGMTSTSSRYADFLERANAASLHVRIDGKWTALVKRNADPQAPAGGVSSTARDLAQWMRLELGRGMYDGARLIPAEAIAATHQPLFARGANPVTGAPAFYGLGWNVEYTSHGLLWSHAGAFSQGARTLVSLLPDSGLGIVVLAAAFPSGLPEGLADSFFDQVFDGALKQDYLTAWDRAYAGLFDPAMAATKAAYAHVPDPATPARPASAYTGAYANAYVGTGVVSEVGGKLILALGPEGRSRYPLTHFDRDLFVYYPDAETPDLPSALSFTLGPDGRAASLTAETFVDTGFGTLTRAAP